jgi:hypothetical protein
VVSSVAEDSSLLNCDSVAGRVLQEPSQRVIVPPSSGSSSRSSGASQNDPRPLNRCAPRIFPWGRGADNEAIYNL